MGPRWFFEGLAISFAGQFETERPPQVRPAWETIADLIARAEANELETPYYPRFAWLFRCLEARVDTAWMIRHAADEDFIEALRLRYHEAGTS